MIKRFMQLALYGKLIQKLIFVLGVVYFNKLFWADFLFHLLPQIRYEWFVVALFLSIYCSFTLAYYLFPKKD